MNCDELLFLLANSTPSAELSLFAMDAIDKLQSENAALRTKLDAVPVRGIAYLMADIVPTDGFDEADQHEARAAVVAWLEALETGEVQP
jgi:hypothetical protein